MTDALLVTRWTRYGQDRLYVKTSDGVTVGWQCLRTGARTVEVEALRASMLAVLEGHPAVLDRRASPPPPSRAERETPVRPMSPATPASPPAPMPAFWTDLTSNLPGQGLLADAAALRAQHPWRFGICRIFGWHSDERAKRVGAKGEQMVAARLARLPDGWRTIHAIIRSEAGTDVDHLVIGPAGVFTINSKYHRGKSVWVGGDNVRIGGGKPNHVYESRSEVKAVRRLLTAACGYPVEVQGLVAVVCERLTIKEQPRDVTVIGRRDLDAWLKKQPDDRLTPTQVMAIYERARRSTTWMPG